MAIGVKCEIAAAVLLASARKIVIETAGLYLCCIYSPPASQIDDIMLDLGDCIAVCTNPQKHLIVGGDFNCDLLRENGRREAFIEGCTDLGLAIENRASQPTYFAWNGKSQIDLVLSTAPRGSTLAVNVRPVTTPDRKHCKVIFNLDPQTVGLPPPQTHAPRLASRKVNPYTLTAALRNPPSDDDINALETFLREGLLQATAPPPSPNARPRHKPWFDNECREVKRAVLAAVRAPDTTPLSLEQFSALKRKFRDLKRRKRLAYWEKEKERRITESVQKPWILLKKSTRPPNPLINHESWIRHFTELFSRPADLPPKAGEDLDPLGAPFTVEEVTEVIRRKQNGKAAGPDALVYEHFKADLPTTAPILTNLLNACLKQAHIPEVWKRCLLTPLFKGKGDPTNPDNYRGIALLSIPYKVLTSVITARLQTHCLHRLPETQFGFLPKRSTTLALKHAIDYIKTKQNARKPTYAAFIDFKKAFDSVPRGRLLSELANRFSIQGRMFNLLRGLLEANFIRIKNGSATVDQEIKQTVGVPQGDPASPFLYIAYATGLAECLNAVKAEHVFYADDLVIMAKSRDQLQFYLREAATWCRENELQINTSKTKIMRFGAGGAYAKMDHKITINGHRLELVSSFPYLGVTLTPKLSFTRHLQEKSAKAAAAMALCGNLQEVSIKTAMNLFRIKILPIVSYALKSFSHLLTLENLKQIDRVKTTFLKRALGLHRNASSTLSLQLTHESSLVEELILNGYEFPQASLEPYRLFREARNMEFVANRFTDGPAFLNDKWRSSLQKNRSLVCRTTAHGFHHKLCLAENFCDQGVECICKYCGERGIARYHILQCSALDHTSLAATVAAL